jgi:hypothetical protein
MSDAEIYTPKQEPVKMEMRTTEMTPTAEKFYAIYDKARAIYRHLRAQNAIPEGARVEMIEEAPAASDTKTDD